MFRWNSLIIIHITAERSKSHPRLVLSLLSIGILFVSSIALGSVIYTGHLAYGAYIKATPSSGGPMINDPNLKVEKVFFRNPRSSYEYGFFGSE